MDHWRISGKAKNRQGKVVAVSTVMTERDSECSSSAEKHLFLMLACRRHGLRLIAGCEIEDVTPENSSQNLP